MMQRSKKKPVVMHEREAEIAAPPDASHPLREGAAGFAKVSRIYSVVLFDDSPTPARWRCPTPLPQN